MNDDFLRDDYFFNEAPKHHLIKIPKQKKKQVRDAISYLFHVKHPYVISAYS